MVACLVFYDGSRLSGLCPLRKENHRGHGRHGAARTARQARRDGRSVAGAGRQARRDERGAAGALTINFVFDPNKTFMCKILLVVILMPVNSHSGYQRPLTAVIGN